MDLPGPARQGHLWGAPTAGASLLFVVLTACQSGSQQPDVLLVIVDDLGVADVGAYGVGEAPPRTPTLDALATESAVFTRAWANPVCSPTRATLLTGRHSHRTGVGSALKADGPGGLPLAEQSLPETVRGALGRRKYRFGAFGKWHLATREVGGAGHALEQGFDRFRGSFGSLQDDMSLSGQPQDYYEHEIIDQDQLGSSSIYATTETVDDAIDWIEDQDGPWFAWVALHAAHGPWNPPPLELYGGPEVFGGDPQRDRFSAVVTAMDTELSRLLEFVGDDTTVILVADNGTSTYAAAAPYGPENGKGHALEGGVRVPLMVRSPWVDTPGRLISALVHTVDVFATAVEVMTGEPPQHDVDGVSFLELLGDPSASAPRDLVYAERFSQSHDWWLQTVRDDRFKLVRHTERADTLYDLGHDWVESDDLLAHTQPLSADAEAAYERLSEALAPLSLRP